MDEWRCSQLNTLPIAGDKFQVLLLIMHFNESAFNFRTKIIESKLKSIHFEALEIAFPVILPFYSESIRFSYFGWQFLKHFYKMWQSMSWQPRKLDANLTDWIVMLSMLSVHVTLLWILIYKNEIIYSMCHIIQTLKYISPFLLLLKIDKTK